MYAGKGSFVEVVVLVVVRVRCFQTVTTVMESLASSPSYMSLPRSSESAVSLPPRHGVPGRPQNPSPVAPILEAVDTVVGGGDAVVVTVIDVAGGVDGFKLILGRGGVEEARVVKCMLMLGSGVVLAMVWLEELSVIASSMLETHES